MTDPTISEPPSAEDSSSHRLPGLVVDSVEHRLLEAKMLRRLVGEPSEEVRVDRFVIERELGAGGMGTVYEARDEQLQRRVALKFLRRVDDDEGAELRLYREAQGLAQISHPNVVPVYDVGRHEGRVWIAMEYVQGQTLRAWAQEAPRSHREVLDRWVEAGRGLAVVHEAGLIHRDIKPDNVLLGEDGRVRLVDFGLVAASRHLSSTGPQTSPQTEREWSPLTEHEGFLGTPAYAAPEQHGGRVDARADQYALCVCLWEALCGTRPARSFHSGLVSLPDGVRLPARLHRALSRGLSPEPEDRFPNVEALLSEIQPRSRRRWPESLVALSLAAVGGMWLSSGPGDPMPSLIPCAEAAAPISESWSSETRTEVAERLREVGADKTLDTLDQWVADWSAATQEACEDVHVRQILSSASLDRRGPCLDRELASFEVIVQGVASGALGDEARVAALGALHEPDSCLVDEVLEREVEAIPSAQTEAVAELRRGLLRLELERGGRSVAGRLAAAEHLLERSRELGWQPLIGEATLVVGRFHTMIGDSRKARILLGEALDIGESTRDMAQQLNAWSALNQVERLVDLDVERARWALSRQAATLREGQSSPRRRARLLSDEGQTEELAGRLDRAERSLREALALLDDEGALADWNRANVLHALGNLLSHTDRSDEARRMLTQARNLELGRASGDDRPGQRTVSTVATEFDEALAMIASGEYRGATERLQHVMTEARAEYGPRSEMVARVHVALAAAYDYLGEVDQVRRHAELADQISLRSVGPTHPMRADVLSAVGVAATHEGRTADAVHAFEWSLRIVRRLKEPESLDVALAEHNLVSALVDAGDLARAEDLMTHALPILEEQLGDDDALLLDARRMLNESRVSSSTGPEHGKRTTR